MITSQKLYSPWTDGSPCIFLELRHHAILTAAGGRVVPPSQLWGTTVPIHVSAARPACKLPDD